MDGVKKKAAVVIALDPDDDDTKPLPYTAAMRRIRRLWREGNTTWREHADERRQGRKFTTPELERLMLEGNITGHGHSEGHWKYTVEDRQRTLKASVSIRRNLLFIISVMRNEWKG
jgi:hypothetical protein